MCAHLANELVDKLQLYAKTKDLGQWRTVIVMQVNSFFFRLLVQRIEKHTENVCDSIGQIARSVERQNGSPKGPGSRPGTAEDFYRPVTYGGQCGFQDRVCKHERL